MLVKKQKVSNRLKRIIAISTILLLPVFTFASNEVTIADDTTLVLPSDSSSYTLSASSQYDSLTINNDSFSFTLSQAGRLTLTSTDRKSFSHNAGGTLIKATVNCNSDKSTIDVSIDSPFDQTSITITPSGTCSSSGGGVSGGGGGGGGGGGSGGGSYEATPAPTQQTLDKVSSLKEQIAQVQGKIAQKIATSAGASASVSYGTVTKDLTRGSKGDEVKVLQQMLAADKDVYPDGQVTGYYGSLTTTAVKKFQAKYGLPQVGRVGPMTRKKLNEIYGLAATVQTPAAPVALGPQAPVVSSIQASPELLKSIQGQIQALQAKLIQEQIKLIQEKINGLKK